ncbi:MAG: STAS domain-containing protein [Chitinivibrionales bacterium]|nr:STAS domain-containing protein [Chitinivibrionales bacterium]MBD3396148.1 STAS domain-containing protein [Chitinivibrionales bacterium]
MQQQQSPAMPIEVVYQNGYQIIRIAQTLDRGMDLSPLRSCIEQALAQGINRVALSLTPDSFLYSEILAHLVTYYKMVNAQGGSLWIVQANEKILFILETIGLSDLIHIVPSEDALPAA